MSLRLKNWFTIAVTMLFATQVSALETSEVIDVPSSPIQWVRYLSDMEKGEIAGRLAQEEYQRREAAGTLYDKSQRKEVSFPASFTPIDSAPDTSRSSAAYIPSGNVNCSINTQDPHAGSGPGGSTVVKAKSSGTCTYIHTGPGPQPPSIRWDLTQALFRVILVTPPSVDVQSAVHTRNSLNASWSASSAQIFHPSCINDTYSHFDYVYVTPPSGWRYTGPQPIVIPNTAAATVSNC
jgi:hypothetical protein